MNNNDSQKFWTIYYDKYCAVVVTVVEYVSGKARFNVVFKVFYPSKMQLYPVDGYDWRDQGVWHTMVSRTNWKFQAGSGNRQYRHPTRSIMYFNPFATTP